MGCDDNEENNFPKMKTVDYVDLERFMGDWYVIANIPTFIEKNATNAIESYSMTDNGKIKTVFTFFHESPTGKKKHINQQDLYIIRKRMLNGECNLFGHSKCHFI